MHNLYAPTQKEVDHARRVVEAAEAAAREGLGVVSLNGKMVDGPVIDRARLVLSRAELSVPTQKEVDHARRVVEAAEAAAREGLGVVSLNGKMVDGPVIDRARLVLSRAELSGIREE